MSLAELFAVEFLMLLSPVRYQERGLKVRQWQPVRYQERDLKVRQWQPVRYQERDLKGGCPIHS